MSGAYAQQQWAGAVTLHTLLLPGRFHHRMEETGPTGGGSISEKQNSEVSICYGNYLEKSVSSFKLA